MTEAVRREISLSGSPGSFNAASTPKRKGSSDSQNTDSSDDQSLELLQVPQTRRTDMIPVFPKDREEKEKSHLSEVKERLSELKTVINYQTLKLLNELEEKQHDIVKLNQENEELKIKKDEMQCSLAEKSEEVAKLQGEKEDIFKNLRDMEEERDNMDEENTDLREEINILKKQLEEGNPDANRNSIQAIEYAVEEGNSEVENEMRAVQIELISVKKQRDEMKVIIETKQRRYEEISKTVDKMQTELRKRDGEIKHMEEFILPFVREYYQQEQNRG